MSKRTELIRVRVSPKEKAELEDRAGSMGVSALVRSVLFNTVNTSVSAAGSDADGGSEGRDSVAKSLPAKNWPARVRQLTASGVPRPAAERIADLEFRG